MQKLYLWTIFAAAVLAQAGLSPTFGKRQIEHAKWNNKAELDGGLNITQVDVSSRDGTSKLTFSPDELDGVLPGTVIQFNFWPKNHTVTESSFAEPCKPLAKNLTSDTHPGIRTGFVPVKSVNETSFTAFRIMINDTKPIWLYCGQATHCQQGMVMVINPNNTSGKTLQAYKDAAKLVTPATPGNSSSTTAAPSSSSSSPSSSTAPAVNPVSGASTTAVSDGPSLASSTATAPSSAVSVFNGNAARTLRPGKFVVAGVLAVAGLFSLQ